MTLPKIINPLFRVELPSTKQPVSIRCMLVREEKILLVAKESENPLDIYTAIKQVVKNCTETDIDKITTFDLEYLFLKIRAISISNIVKVTYKDTEDVEAGIDKNYEFDIDLDAVKLRFPSTNNVISFTNDKDVVEIDLRYPLATLYDDPDIMKKTEAGLVLKSDVEILDKLRVAVIENIKVNGVKQDIPSERETIAWLDELPMKISNSINEFIGSTPNLHHELTYTNSKGHERRIVLSKLNDFFTLR